MNTFGQRGCEFRRAKGRTLRELAPKVAVGVTYLSKVENERLDFGDSPSEALIQRLADALDDEEELQLLAERVPDRIRQRVLQRPGAFGRLAELDDRALNHVIASLGST